MVNGSKKAICFYFQVHQPFRLRRYRFFDLGIEHYYYDDYTNESIMRKVADKCYLPTNKLLLSLIKEHKGKFKVSFSITGIAIRQFKLYAPEVLDSFRALAETGMVEFLAETNAHSLASLKSKTQFEKQVNEHVKLIRETFGVEPTSFRNTELIYSDLIGSWVADMGFESILTEGAKHILGWKSPNFLYCNAINPRLKVLLRNFVLSDDIAFRFSNKSWMAWPLTADKYATWLNKLAPNSELLNIFLDYETFGEHNSKETGIFDFLRYLPAAILKKTPFSFLTPSEVANKLQPVSAINVNTPISWADEERDVTAWLGNELQNAAIDKLYSLEKKVERCKDEFITKNWEYLQTSDNFYYMATKFFSDGAVHAYFNPFETPYDAFLNYMNILSDFEIQINRNLPEESDKDKILKLEAEIQAKDLTIASISDELKNLKARPKRKTVKVAETTREVETTKTKAKTKGASDKKSVVKKSVVEEAAPEATPKVVRRPKSTKK